VVESAIDHRRLVGAVDLRSDTVTRPSAEMRRLMADAEVGDDGFGDDPTVRRLEEAYAERVGKQAGLFVPSGTMANQIAFRLLGAPGTAVIAGRGQHIVGYEQGAVATNAWAMVLPIADDDGTLDPAEIAALVEAGGPHHGLRVGAVFVENTHMPSGGRPWPLDRLRAVSGLGVPVHLDGARLFNAEVATGVSVAAYAATATTVMSAMSKGLGAPIGSVLAADADVIEAARVERKRLGGGMRQAGIVAAAALYGLRHNVERLADDHARARRLAEAVAERWPECGLDPGTVATNIVVFRHGNTDALLAHLAAEGVLALTIGPQRVRLMTHLDVDDDGVERARKAIATAPA
jgi:threonine aldolase